MEEFNRHLFSGDTAPSVSKVLHVTHSGEKQPLAARYVLKAAATVVPVAPSANWFVPIINMAPIPACNAIVDGIHLRRQATKTGTLTIRDRRIPSYNDSQIINNVSFYIATADLTQIAEQEGLSPIERLPTLLDRAEDDPVMFHFAKVVESVLERPSEASPFFLTHLYQAVCGHIAIVYGGLTALRHAQRGGLPPRQEARVKELILSDLRGDFSLARVAASCNLSERHFVRTFKQSTGSPPHRWLMEQRVQRAQALLGGTNATISQIAFDCGFASQSHMTRVFTKAIGTSPGAWRRARKG